MKHDTDVHDTGSESSAPQGKPPGGAVNTSRRRFTRAGLSASAVLTLANRPALATYCSHSGTMSGNLSRPGGQPTCHGMTSGYWKMNEQQWASTTCEPGKCNATTYASNQCMDYNHCTWGELKARRRAANDAGDTTMVDRCNDYKTWANWSKGTLDTALPSPSTPPTTLGEIFSGTGLTPTNPTMTMMQAFWGGVEADGLVVEACTAFLNADYFGRESFGYNMAELKTFMSGMSHDPSALQDALHFLNNRG